MKIFCLTLCALLTWQLAAQTEVTTPDETAKKGYFSRPQYLTVQWLGWTYHPGGGAVHIRKYYLRKLDEEAYYVWSPGVSVNYDLYHRKRLWWRFSTSVYKDCADRWAGHLHLGFRASFNIGKRHSFNTGLGPTLTFRKDWHVFEEYRGTDFYGDSVWRDWQYRFIPGGELEYQFLINDKWSFVYTVIPALPVGVISKIGVRAAL